MTFRRLAYFFAGIACWLGQDVALAAAGPEILFDQVRVFDGQSSALTEPTRVLVRGNRIAEIGPDIEAGPEAQVIDGAGNTLMPGLIDVHVHLTFSSMTMAEMMAPELTPQMALEASARAAEAMLMRGFTAVRDLGGPIWELKAGITAGQF